MKEETKKVNQAEETNSSEIISQPVNTLLSGLDDKELTNYATIANEIEEIVLDDNLAHYDIIPDYLESTQSIHPIGVKINGKTHIIDGWEKVDRAKNEGKASIKCCVYYINEFSDIEIALRKISIRMLPLGGTLRYSEILRNISIFKELLLKSSVNIVEYSHGGNRKDKTAGEINIRDLLAERTGKEPGTIGNYFLHADYISKKAFDELVKAEEATKAFFEKLGDKGCAKYNASAADHGHFSREGALAVAKLVAEGLRAKVPELAPLVKISAPGL